MGIWRRRSDPAETSESRIPHGPQTVQSQACRGYCIHNCAMSSVKFLLFSEVDFAERCLWRIPSFLRFPVLRHLVMPRARGLTAFHPTSTRPSPVAFHTSASQGVERDAIHATRAGI